LSRDINDINATGVAFTHTLYAMLKKPTAQIAHLVFADTQANAEKPKELFFANARQKRRRLNLKKRTIKNDSKE
jgi:hypothetical protein